MARADDDEALRRRSRARPRAPPPTSIASMYAPIDAPNGPPARSSKMKMASLMAVVDEESKNKRVKVDDQQSDGWAPRNAPISISSLTTSSESPASSLFQHEMPTIIPSFSRDAVEVNGETKNGAANGDASPAATRSVLDYYFPSGRSESNGSSGNRSLKRKRRSSRRDELTADVDLLRFGVDAAKLVPQGLVDRVDAHMSRAVLLKVVDNHVTNWCNRSGFAPSFLQEITTLLAAYYPCNYPTLLDEVLAGFLFKRPEFMDLLLPAMLEKMSKAGESVSTTKYPVADALVRMCGSPVTTARHDLACRSLLRCLVEHNGDRFALSPWIAACAIESSDGVLQSLWRALLPRTQEAENWRIEDPGQQIVELLAEEGKLRVCQFSCGFVELLLSDDELKKQLEGSQSYLIPDCLERAFKYASTSWSSSLMTEWLERRRKHKDAGSLKDLVGFFVRFNAKLSVKKPEWFVNHVLSFALSPHCPVAEQESVLRAILSDHMSFLFGTQSLKSEQNGSSEASAVTDLDVVGSQSVLEVQSKLELLVGLLVAANARTSALFLDIWSQAWLDKIRILPWSYVHSLLCVTIQGAVDDRSALGQKLQSFTTRVCRSYYRRLSNVDKDEEVASKFSETLNLLLPSIRPVAGILLQEVLAVLADLAQNRSADACAIFGNAVALHLGKCGEPVDNSVKRSVVQKSLVEYDRSPAIPATIDLLTTLKTLASIKNDTGDFTRRVLSRGSVVRLLSSLLNFGRRRRRQEMLLDVMNVVVVSNTSVKLNRDWTRQYVVQELVHCAYTGPPNSARKATALLQNIFRHSTCIPTLLWVILQQCTKLCCGREEKAKVDNLSLNSENYQGRADTFAELVKAMVIAVPSNTVREVLCFVEQKLASCSIGQTRMNLFLLLLLRKLVVCELQCSVLLPVVQRAVCPLARSDLNHIRLIQLQLLKALCTRLVATRQHPVTSKLSHYEDWKRCEDLLCNERLQADLRSVLKGRTGRASEVLAQGILACTHRLRHESSIDDEDGARRILKKSRMK
ncbi:hypothetical protein, variant 2 [Phytophthora nicotianae CJ01A1]|uniref:Uncharacterized protein n=4 Tax=Phytophthora nicotianae TaxID=4792 RepID=V9G0C4_PHYNI|nr:hypothetical protein F443_01008 [Phytophthora nicotianae P1569]ETM02689.1 hypothetical protein L917_00901 [Phytophthora nicotianae]ETP26248.1 hypothetical protein F441_00981 [Phytophthora nicotianae CJ01A1]ETP54304.1 hypothetical protein F442_00960 [Phytophthora nicotianae P10297]ETI56482.1 hypothetical protein, variant 1 [Phytophthora nicotianae P1569]